MKRLLSNLFEKIKGIFTSKHTRGVSEQEMFSLPYTKKMASQKVKLFYIFENIYDELEEYRSAVIAPLYIALSEEESVAACLRITYLKHIDQYLQWCALRNCKPGIRRDSWWEYLTENVGDFNDILANDFKVIVTNHTIGDLVSMYRCFNGASVLLGLPTETPGEVLNFMEKESFQKENPLIPKDIDTTNPTIAPIKNYFNYPNLSEYLGKLMTLNYDELGSVVSPGLKEVWEIVYSGQENPSTALASDLIKDFQKILQRASLIAIGSRQQQSQQDQNQNQQKE